MASLFTSQTPSVTDASDGTPGITSGTTVQFAVAGTVTHIRFYATATVSGTYTGALWRVTAADTPSPAGTLLASKVMGAAPTGGTWNTIALDTPIAVTPGVLYRTGVHNSAGRYVATNNLFASSLTNGDITADANGSDPVALGTLRQGVFAIDAALTYPSTAGSSASYFADVVFEPDGTPPAEGSAALGVGLAVAATGARASRGAAALGFNFAIAVTGVAGIVVPVASETPNGWFGLLAISQEAREMWREEQRTEAAPVACWNDGEPLLDGHCRFCGRMYPT